MSNTNELNQTIEKQLMANLELSLQVDRLIHQISRMKTKSEWLEKQVQNLKSDKRTALSQVKRLKEQARIKRGIKL